MAAEIDRLSDVQVGCSDQRKPVPDVSSLK